MIPETTPVVVASLRYPRVMRVVALLFCWGLYALGVTLFFRLLQELFGRLDMLWRFAHVLLLVLTPIGGFIVWALFEGVRNRGLRPTGPRCDQCDYDLTGNVSGRCPECGAEL